MGISPSRCILVCAIMIGCSSSKPHRSSDHPITFGACDMAATARSLSGAELSFDTRTATVAYDHGMGSLVGTATSSGCSREPQGFVASLTGTGTWDGAPDHRFALHAFHIPGEIATPEPGWTIDSASLQVVSPTGELVHGNGGFVDAPFDTVAASSTRQDCTVSGSGTLVSRDFVSISGVNTAAGIASGTLEVRGAPGGGPLTRIVAQIGSLTCRNDGIPIADVAGYGTVDGIGGYVIVAQVEDWGGARADHMLIVVFDASDQEVLQINADAPNDTFSVVF